MEGGLVVIEMLAVVARFNGGRLEVGLGRWGDTPKRLNLKVGKWCPLFALAPS